MQKENNEDNLMETSQLKSESNEVKEEQQQLSPEVELAKYNANKVVYLALLDAAMRYREATWREDIIVFEGQYKQMLPQKWEGFRIAYKSKFDREPDGGVKRNWERDMERKIKNEVDVFRKEIEAFNRQAYKEVEKVVKVMSKKGQVDFDNYATGFGLLMEEFMSARNTTEMLTICRLYNAGKFDDAFDQALKEEGKEPIATPESEPVKDFHGEKVTPSGIILPE